MRTVFANYDPKIQTTAPSAQGVEEAVVSFITSIPPLF